MLRLTKKTEYSLLALQYMAARFGHVTTAKEISEAYGISFELVAKQLQILQKNGFIQSFQGPTGGYIFLRAPGTISLADVIYTCEGKPEIVECADNAEHECACQQTCTIKTPMQIIQKRLEETFQSMTIAEMI